jgi:hypothetical protein
MDRCPEHRDYCTIIPAKKPPQDHIFAEGLKDKGRKTKDLRELPLPEIFFLHS